MEAPTLIVKIRHRHSKNAGNIIYDGGFQDWTGAIPRKGEFIELSEESRKAYNLPKNLMAFVQDVVWDFNKNTVTVNADV